MAAGCSEQLLAERSAKHLYALLINDLHRIATVEQEILGTEGRLLFRLPPDHTADQAAELTQHAVPNYNVSDD